MDAVTPVDATARVGRRNRRAPFAVLVDPSSYRTVAASWAARNFAAGGIGAALLVVSVLLLYGRPPGFRVGPLIALSAGLTAYGLLASRLFRRSLTAGLSVSAALTTVSVAAFAAAAGSRLSADVTQAVVMVAASAPILYARRWALAMLGGALISCGAVLATEPHAPAGPDRIAVLGFQTALYAMLMLWFSGTLSRLAAHERQARAETEFKRAALLGLDERKRKFLHQMSHAFRTPLNAIIGFSEMLELGLAGHLDERQQEYLQPITASGRHLLALVDDVLDVGRVDEGQTELIMDEFPVARVVEDSIVLCREQAYRADIHLRVDCPKEIGMIVADERKARQILINLLSNALKFTPAGGHVRLEVRDVNGGVEFLVSDSGPGVRPADRERIFRAYEQGESKTSGTGLGLPVAREMARSHGGRLELRDTAEPGATFVAWLPRRPLGGIAGGPKIQSAVSRDKAVRPLGGDPGILDDGSALERLVGRRGLARHRARLVGAAVLAEGACCVTLFLLPHAEGFRLLLWPYMGFGMLAAGVVLLHPRVGMKARTTFGLNVVGVALMAWYVWKVGHPLTSSMATILVMESIAAFTFFRLRRAVVIGVETAILYGAIQWANRQGDMRLIHWLLSIGLIASGGVLARWLLRYLPALVESENQARRETERVNRQLQAASRHKGEFLAAMSHELRTPLNAIIGYADALRQGMFGALDAETAEYLDVIAAAGRHLLALINDILDLAKADAGHLQLNASLAPISEVVAAASTGARERAERSGIEFIVSCAPNLPDIEADPVRLARAVTCIVDNAVDFTPPGGRVVVTTTADGGGVRISVRDSGPGIAAEDQDRIFAAFEHGGGDAPSGSGIGLALARKLVELHHGTVTLHSTPGSGSEFFVHLPAAGVAVGAEADAYP